MLRVRAATRAGVVSVAAVSASLLVLDGGGALTREFALGVALAAGGYLLVLWIVQRRAARVGRPVFTLASTVTAIRGAVALILGGFVVTGGASGPVAWVPALLFGGVAVLDAVDGYVARRRDAVSTFGSNLDVEVDALALLLAILVAVRLTAVPLVFLFVGLARYAFVMGLFVRRQTGRPTFELPPRRRRKAVGALSMAVVFVVLIPVVPPAVASALALALLLPVMYSFAVDWLYVTGARTVHHDNS